MTTGNSIRDRDWKPIFLEALGKLGVLGYAADAAGVDRSTVFRHRASDPVFSELVDEMCEAGIDKLETEAWERAMKGRVKGVWHMGVRVGEELVYSDALMALLLKGRRKKVFADRTELTGEHGGPMQSQYQVTIATGVPHLDDGCDLV